MDCNGGELEFSDNKDESLLYGRWRFSSYFKGLSDGRRFNGLELFLKEIYLKKTFWGM